VYTIAYLFTKLRHGLDLWPLTLITFSEMPTQMNISDKFHWNRSTNKETASREIAVNGRTDNRETSCMSPPPVVREGIINPFWYIPKTSGYSGNAGNIEYNQKTVMLQRICWIGGRVKEAPRKVGVGKLEHWKVRPRKHRNSRWNFVSGWHRTRYTPVGGGNLPHIEFWGKGSTEKVGVGPLKSLPQKTWV